MNGGAWERVAGYLDNGNNNLNKYGNSTSNDSIKYFQNGKPNGTYTSLWDSYEVSEEEKSNQIVIEGELPISQDDLWDYTKREVKYQTARKRLTDYNFKQMAKHKGIGVNEVASECSYFAPYNDKQNRDWFMTAEEPAKESGISSQYARSWDYDGVLIGHAALPFVVRGGGFNHGTTAGVLYTNVTNGYADCYYGFRHVLVL